MNDLELQAARHCLGIATGEDLVRAAEQSMLAGAESKSLALLVSEADPIMSDVAPLFERALNELSLDVPTKEEACWIVLRHHMTRIVNKQVGPRDGMQAIVREVYRAGDLYGQTKQYVGDSHDLHHFLGWYSGIDDIQERPAEVSFDGKYGTEAIAAIESRIFALADQWLQEHGA